MALKKSGLYSSLRAGCDELRHGMDASQYKDYVLVLLFIKYVSDKYAGQPFAPITIPEGASFKDMVALKGKSDIGDQINKKIIGPLANANKLWRQRTARLCAADEDHVGKLQSAHTCDSPQYGAGEEAERAPRVHSRASGRSHAHP